MSARTDGLELRKQRWRAFLSPNAAPQRLLVVNFTQDEIDEPRPWPDKAAERVEWAWIHYNRQMERLDWVHDDTVPYLWVHTGTEIFAEAFGCEVYRPEHTAPSARPFVRTPGQAARVRVPDIGAGPLATLFEMADELHRRAGNGAVFRLVDIQSPMDIAALIWDKSTFFTAVLEAPDAVRELAHKVQELLCAFLDEWFRRYGADFVAHYPDYYMTHGITLSADEIGSVSALTFDALFLPELVELSNRYGQIGIHSCANSRHQWESIKKIPDLRLLNLVQPYPVIQEAYCFFANHTAHMHFWPEADTQGAPWVNGHPSDARIAFQVTAKSGEEARRLSEQFAEGRAASGLD